MATLNDAPFKIIRQVFTTVQNNSIKDILGSDTVSVEHMGYSTEPLRLVCFVQNEDEYDNFKEEYHSSGTQTLIIHENSGRQYTVYGLGSTTEIDGEIENYKQGIVFLATFKQATPYKESTEEITRTKSITTQNQEWTADDDGNHLKTDGNVDAVPDIQITGGDLAGTELASNPVGEPSFETIAGWTYAEVDTNGKITGAQGDVPEEGTYSYKISVDPGVAVNDYGQIYRTVDFTDIEILSLAIRLLGSYSPGATEIYVDGNLVESFDDVYGAAYQRKYADVSAYTGSLTLIIRWKVTIDVGVYIRWDDIRAYRAGTENVEIYNTEDTSTKCSVANKILNTAVHRINIDGTGTISYEDDFSSSKYLAANSGLAGITHDTVNDELDIADDGYIYWPEDTKYPITGTPTLTARINITTGTSTIQISTDASTWYDIDTAIVDNVETVYPLDSDGNLSLAGKTVFYWRIDCVKAAAATCSVKSFKLDIAIHTIYAKNPKINKGASASTFRCDQDSDSGLDCEVTLIFRHRWWT